MRTQTDNDRALGMELFEEIVVGFGIRSEDEFARVASESDAFDKQYLTETLADAARLTGLSSEELFAMAGIFK